MKTEINLLIHTKSGLGVTFADYTPSKNDDYVYKIRKAVLWPNGTVHSKYYLTFTTGEWVRVPPSSRIPDECLMNDNLRHMLDPERPTFSSGIQGIRHAFDAEKANDQVGRELLSYPLLSETMKYFEETAVDGPGYHVPFSREAWRALICKAEKLEIAIKEANDARTT